MDAQAAIQKGPSARKVIPAPDRPKKVVISPIVREKHAGSQCPVVMKRNFEMPWPIRIALSLFSIAERKLPPSDHELRRSMRVIQRSLLQPAGGREDHGARLKRETAMMYGRQPRSDQSTHVGRRIGGGVER